MNITLLPLNKRKAKCYCCGTGKSVKYAVSTDDDSLTIKVCNKCLLCVDDLGMLLMRIDVRGNRIEKEE
jgi:hypothetical protein